MRSGRVYVMTDATGFVKVGKSKNPDRRLKQIFTGNITIRLAFMSDVVDDAFEAEARCHDLLSLCAVTGEWFDCGIDAAIATVKVCTVNNCDEEAIKLAGKVKVTSYNKEEQSYADMLAGYIDCGGSKSATVLAWIIKNRKDGNYIYETQTEIAEKSGVSVSVVKTVFKKLISKGYVKKVNVGKYMVTPRMIQSGDNQKGAMNLKLWTNTER